MSFNRTLSLFRSATNHTLGFATNNGNLTAFVDAINNDCALQLTAINDTCGDSEPLVWGGVSACENEWLKQFGIDTCEKLETFSNTMLDCIEDASKKFFNSQEERCPPMSPLVWIIPLVVLAALVIIIIAAAVTQCQKDRVRYQPI